MNILKKFLTHPIFLIALVMILLGWLGYTMLQPVIVSVPILKQGDALTILGHGFGNSGYLMVRSNGQSISIRETVSWSDNQIVGKLPSQVSEGNIQVVKLFITDWTSNRAMFITQANDLPSQPYGYQNPVQPDAPWATFRHDPQNTGASPIQAQYNHDQPWSFRTGKGIFSTSVIDRDGTVYVGSADHVFYALNPNGTEKWHFVTGEIIDSAAALPRRDPKTNVDTILVPSGDGHLYALRTDKVADKDRVLWSYQATSAPGTSFNNWFEGNVAIGYDGTLYAGNTNFNYYALTQDGQLKWKYPTASNAWSLAAFGKDGTIYWGSNDTYIRAVAPDGTEQWKKMTLGFIAASAAVGSDGTVYMGSFDSYFYALDPKTGNEKWKFKTNDHIYGSAALGADANGNTNAIYIGSTDGWMYALSTDGKLLWKYDTGDPIRSSPVLGRAPNGEPGNIVYFGSGNGKLYALNAQDGTRRWSFDTTPSDPELRDRNDLNASDALGTTGIYIGGEHGYVWYVPYDYCLTAKDDRCQTNPHDDLPQNVTGLFYVTPGGSTEMTKPSTLPSSTIITMRLMIRQNGERLHAWVCNAPIGCASDSLRVTADPGFPFQVQHSADGQYLYILPDSFLEPGKPYTLTVEGDYYTGGLALGNLTLGGDRAGQFKDTFAFRVEDSTNALPLSMKPDQVTALEWTRLAAPIPTMLPSLNQIGFDYMDWIVAPVAMTLPDANQRGKMILWAIGGKRNADGALVADAQTDFTLPLCGVYQNDSFILTDEQFTMPITGIPIPFNRFQLRGRLGVNGVVQPGATAYADTETLSIPRFGPYLVIAGLANNWVQKLLVAGTYITRPYDPRGAANLKPQGVSLASLDYTAPTSSQAGKVVANFQLNPGTSYPLAAHRPGILLVDGANTSAVFMDYQANLSSSADANGNLASVILTIPAKTAMPKDLRAIVVLDVFPLEQRTLNAK